MSASDNDRVGVGNLHVDPALFDFIERELLPAIDAVQAYQWLLQGQDGPSGAT